MFAGKARNAAGAITAWLLSGMLTVAGVPTAKLAVGATAISALALSVGASEARGRIGGARHVSTRTVHRDFNRSTTRNVNRNINRHVDVDVDWDRHHYHPVARGVAAGVAIGVTAAVVGSIVYSLPGGCRTVVVNGIAYRDCGSVWYAPRYQGSQVVYVVVNEP